MFDLVLRLVVSLAVVIGLLLLLARLGQRRFRGGSQSLIQVVHRQPLSRSSAIAVVTVGSRVLVLGTTEHQVTTLAELDHDELELAEESASVIGDSGSPSDPSDPSAPRTSANARAAHDALSGSLLSAETWKKALAAATRRAK